MFERLPPSWFLVKASATVLAQDIRPLDAVKECAALVKRTWGENVAGPAGLSVELTLRALLCIVLQHKMAARKALIPEQCGLPFCPDPKLLTHLDY